MVEKIHKCPNPFCKLLMRTLTVKKKADERYCEACGTSIDRYGKVHYKRDVDRQIAETQSEVNNVNDSKDNRTDLG